MQTVQIHSEILLSGFVLLQPLLEHWIHPGQRMDGLWCDTTGEPTCRCEFVSEYNYRTNTAVCATCMYHHHSELYWGHTKKFHGLTLPIYPLSRSASLSSVFLNIPSLLCSNSVDMNVGSDNLCYRQNTLGWLTRATGIQW